MGTILEWGRNMTLAIVQCFQMPQGSEYQVVLFEACKDYAQDFKKASVQALGDNFESMMKTFDDIEGRHISVVLRSKLQLLRWAFDVTADAWSDLWKLQPIVSVRLQEVVDEMASVADADFPSAKRRCIVKSESS